MEARRQFRLGCLKEFEPGQVQSGILREAIGRDREGEWLRNMAIWGYPKGWVGERDPREEVYRIIVDGREGTEDEEEEEFIIFDGDGEDERIALNCFTPSSLGIRIADDDGPQVSDDDDEISRNRMRAPPRSPTHRWAIYPESYFHSEMLPVYKGYALPPVTGSHSEMLTRGDLRDGHVMAEAAAPPQPAYPPPPLPPRTPLLLTIDHEIDEASDMDLSDEQDE